MPEIKPLRLTVKQTAEKLNVSPRKVRREADKGNLTWSRGQITVESIEKWMEEAEGKRARDESDEEIEEKMKRTMARHRGDGGFVRRYQKG